MSKLPPFPLDSGDVPPAIPAIPGQPNGKNSRGARPKSAGDPGGDSLKPSSELTELQADVETKGYVLLWSNVLNDSVAFYRAEEDLHKIPAGFVPYSLQEIEILFREEEDEFSVNGIRLIHEAKKLGGHVVSCEASNESESS